MVKMNERKYIRKTKKIVFESLNGQEKTYIKSEGLKKDTIGFWLRFVRSHFIPCDDCQEKLVKIINDSSDWHIGDDVKPLIELWRKYELDDKSWKETDNRPSTSEEQVRLKDEWYS